MFFSLLILHGDEHFVSANGGSFLPPTPTVTTPPVKTRLKVGVLVHPNTCKKEERHHMLAFYSLAGGAAVL